MLKKILIFTILAGLVSGSVHAQGTTSAISPEKRGLILQFIEVIGTRKNLEANFKEILSRAPAEQKVKLERVLKADVIIEELIPLYDKHFDENELRSFINFYQSEAGRKLLIALPEIMEESIKVSTQFLQKKMSDSQL